MLILPQYCATKALPRMGQFRCHEVYCLIFPEGTKQHSDIFLFSFCSKDNADNCDSFLVKYCFFLGKRWGNLYVTGYCFIFFPHWDFFGISDIFSTSEAKIMRAIVIPLYFSFFWDCVKKKDEAIYMSQVIASLSSLILIVTFLGYQIFFQLL